MIRALLVKPGEAPTAVELEPTAEAYCAVIGCQAVDVVPIAYSPDGGTIDLVVDDEFLVNGSAFNRLAPVRGHDGCTEGVLELAGAFLVTAAADVGTDLERRSLTDDEIDHWSEVFALPGGAA